jgi:hypothetical protein
MGAHHQLDISAIEQTTAPELELVVTPVLSYALAHNRYPIVSSLTVRNSGATVRGAIVRLTVGDAQGELGRAVDLPVDLEPGATTVLTSPDLRMDPSAMAQVEEQRPGRVVAQLLIEDEVVASAAKDVRVLAAQQWLAYPQALALEMLAAHVQPNHPAINSLVSAAAEILQVSTGRSAVEGYQSGSGRADQIVGALVQAMQDRDIRYAEPPASWADVGQKVRNPGEVLDGRIGTCLDTVVVLAAALEQAGIRPLLWLADGHAFLGYWRDELSAGAAMTTDIAALVNQIDLGAIGLIETTMLTSRTDHATMEELHRAPYARWLTGSLDGVLAVTDVHEARRTRILPLPAQVRDGQGAVTVVEYHPALHSAPPREHRPAPVAEGQPRTAVPARVQQWKNALLDLSLRNRLINYTDRSGLALTVADSELGRLEDMVNDGTPITLRPGDRLAEFQRAMGMRSARQLPQDQLAEILVNDKAVFADVTEDSYTSRFRSLAYKARTITEETGANNLYLALGSLAWELDGRPLRSPLVLVPVILKPAARGGLYRLSLDDSGASTPNYCLLEKLRQVDGLDVPGMAEPADDGSGIDLDGAFRALREAIATKGLPYRVEPTVDLAILQFAKFRLWKDLDDNWADLTASPLVNHLVHAPTDPFDDPTAAPAAPDLDELAARCPVAGDASQLGAVAEATAGRTFVLEGPPGTGKSQTITNLLTRAVADGQRVLFVAEKRAALDVVSRRLAAVGMAPFALDLHDKGSKPAVVREQIRRALDHAVAVDEQGLAAAAEDLRSARRNLDRYARRLHEANGAGLSLYGARTQQLAIGIDGPHLPVPVAYLADVAPALREGVRAALTLLPDSADLTRPRPHHPWGFSDDPSVDVDAVALAAGEVDAAIAALDQRSALRDVLGQVSDPEQLNALIGLLGGPPLPLDVLDETRSQRWAQATSEVTGQVAAFVSAAHPGLDRATPAALDLPLADIHAAAQAAASSSWFGRKKRLIAVRDRLGPALRPGVEVPPKEVPDLVAALLQVQSAVHALGQRAAGMPGVQVPAGWNPMSDQGRELVQRQVEWLRAAGRAVADAGATDFTRSLRSWVSAGSPHSSQDRFVVSSLRDSLGRLSQAAHVDASSWSTWSGGSGLLDRWSSGVAERGLGSGIPVSLRRWTAFLADLEPLRAAGLVDARMALRDGAVEADEAVRALDRGVAAASLVERASSTGLDSFDGRVHERSIDRFARTSTVVRGHLTTAVPNEVLRARPFDTMSSRGQVGALQRELAKTRRGLGVRALMAQYGELITSVMPCVLVSPDSVARFFPAQGGLFDLVVFDEASQIRVADAVGALGRARAAVVVGDSKQMPPTTFAEASLDAEESEAAEATVTEDQESILSECVQARVPRRWLSWHYRSQDESLIAFSNHQYYESRLSSFPAPTHGQTDAGVDGRGVSFVRVQGQFQRSGKGKLLRTNPVEAAAVVAEIRRRFDASPDELPSIGVVTFNQQQRAYIDALLRDAGDDRLVEALERTDGEGLFVKNLENVQGDERDVVLFSTGFSANENGQLPLNFGPLNRAGGERRLNVAVTRARRQVVVFSSFDPSALRAEETSSTGIKHLRAYLDVAAVGTDALPRDAQRAALPDRHREEVAEALRDRGLVVQTDVGLSDFKVDLSVALSAEPDRPVMAVLLDGPGWAARGTVGDRDGLPVEVLQRMLRWPAVQRVWLPEWLAEPERVVERLAGAASAPPPVVEAPLPVTPRPAAPAIQSREPSPAVLDGAVDFVPWQPSVAGDRSVLDSLGARQSADRVRAVLRDGIQAEGPIHRDRLSRLTAGAFGLGRVAEARRAAIAALIAPSMTSADFVWPDSIRPDTWGGLPYPDVSIGPSARARGARGDRQRHGGPVPSWSRHDAGRAVQPDPRGLRPQAADASTAGHLGASAEGPASTSATAVGPE